MSHSEQEIQQRVREAERPFWQRLQWIEDASRLAAQLQQHTSVEPPEWTMEHDPSQRSTHLDHK